MAKNGVEPGEKHARLVQSNPFFRLRINEHLACNFRYTKAAPTAKTDDDLLKGVRKYTRTARKAWEAMSLPEDQGVDFEGEVETST